MIPLGAQIGLTFAKVKSTSATPEVIRYGKDHYLFVFYVNTNDNWSRNNLLNLIELSAVAPPTKIIVILARKRGKSVNMWLTWTGGKFVRGWSRAPGQKAGLDEFIKFIDGLADGIMDAGFGRAIPNDESGMNDAITWVFDNLCKNKSGKLPEKEIEEINRFRQLAVSLSVEYELPPNIKRQ